MKEEVYKLSVVKVGSNVRFTMDSISMKKTFDLSLDEAKELGLCLLKLAGLTPVFLKYQIVDTKPKKGKKK